jgi:hypothetical protein
MNTDFPYLLDGFSVESISSKKDYYRSPTIIETATGKENEINEELGAILMIIRS